MARIYGHTRQTHCQIVQSEETEENPK